MPSATGYFTSAIDNGTSGSGSLAWTNPGHAAGAPDGSYATTPTGNLRTNWLEVLGISTSLFPSNSTVTAASISFYGKFSTNSPNITLYIDDGASSSYPITGWTTDQWSSDFAINPVPSAATILSGGFSVDFAFEWGPDTSSLSIDSVRLAVAYTPSGIYRRRPLDKIFTRVGSRQGMW